MNKYNTNINYKIGVDAANGPDFTSLTSTYTVSSTPFEFGDADPASCAHEWWEDTLTVYTSNPPCYQQRCKLCGAVQYRQGTSYKPLPRWIRVVDKDDDKEV